MNDKDNTFVFKPGEPESVVEKEKISRTEKDDYTKARIPQEEEVEEKSALPVIAAILGALLVIVLAMLPFLFSGGDEAPQEKPEKPEITAPVDDDSEEEEEEEIVTKEYLLGYNGGKIYEMENNGGYSVVFEIFDENGEKTDSDKIFITEETVIKDKDKKIRNDIFINFIESQGGDILLMDCVVREKDSVALSIRYNSEEYTAEEELPPEDVTSEELPSEELPSEDLPSEDLPPEDVTSEDAPSEDNPPEDTQAETHPEANEGIVIE